MRLPEKYNYVEAYLTLRCNLKCGYCINNSDGNTIKKREELKAEQWIESLNKIDFGHIPLTFGGGEPTLHKGFYEILGGLKPEIKVDLLTNLQLDIDEFIRNTRPERFTQSNVPAYQSIRASYHIGQVDPEDLIDKAKKLQDKGYSIGIFGLDHPKFTPENMKMMARAVKKELFFFPKNFMGEWNGQLYGNYKYPEGLSKDKKKVICRTKELLISPSGNTYRCHRDLYQDEDNLDNILNSDFKIKDKFRPCSNFGECNPCDVKLKTNFYLGGIDCQVEIKDIIKDK
jgi:hypothetical protein